MTAIPLPTLVGVLDAEIEQLDGVNFAKPRIGLLPVYNFPNYPTTGDIPAVQVHGAWFRVNPVHPSAPGGQPSDSTVVSDLRASNLSLSTQIQDLQRQLAYSQHYLQKEKESRVRAEREVENLRSNLSRSSSGSFGSSSPTIGTNSSQMKLGGTYLSSISIGSISSLTPAKTHSPTSASSTATILPRPQNAPLSTLDSAAYVPGSVPSPVQSPTIARPGSPKGLVAAAVAKSNAVDAAAASVSHRATFTYSRASGSSSGLVGLKSPSNANFSSGSPTVHSPSNSNPSSANSSLRNVVATASSSAPGVINVPIGATASLTDLKVSSSAKLHTTPVGLTPSKSNIVTPAVQLPVTILAPVGGLQGLNPHSSAKPASGPSTTPTTSQPSETHIPSSSSPLLASNPALPSSARPTISPRTPTSTNKSTNSVKEAANQLDTGTGDEDELSEPDMEEEDLLEPGEGFGEIWVAAWAFNAFDEHDASFVVGDRISIINKKSTDWWVGRVLSTGQEGLFPANHLGAGPVQ